MKYVIKIMGSILEETQDLKTQRDFIRFMKTKKGMCAIDLDTGLTITKLEDFEGTTIVLMEKIIPGVIPRDNGITEEQGKEVIEILRSIEDTIIGISNSMEDIQWKRKYL